MPDDAALAVAPFVRLLNGLDNLFNGEILLIPADFLHVGVKEHKIPDQLHDPLPAEKGNQIPVLLRGRATRHILGQCRFEKRGVLFLPYIPELLGRAGGGVLHGVFIGRHDDLGKLVELGNVLCLLVADVLLHGLLHADLRSLALDDSKGDTVEKQHEIRPGVAELVPAVYRKLLGDVKQVVLRMLPINILQIEAEGFPLSHGLRVALAQQQGVIDFFAGAHQAVGQGLVQILHCPLKVGGGKLIFRTREGIAVEPPELPPEDVFEQHLVPAAPLRFAVLRRYVGITHGLQQLDGRLLADILF